MWTPCSTIEPCGNPGTFESMFEQPLVVLGRSDEDRHVVKRHAVAGLPKNAPRDLDALTALAWRRKELQRAVGRGWNGCLIGKEIRAQPIEIRACGADRRFE